MTKGDLLRKYLEEQGARLRPTLGYQQIRCINEAEHPRGDRRPSASVHLGKGRYCCFSCGLTDGRSIDVYDLLMRLENLDYKSAVARLGTTQRSEEQPTWI